jgi:NTP pyrophosphatase (non-canonical NTP hydrolase)
MTEEYDLTIHPFVMGKPKEAALKPLEEAAEAFGAWQELGTYQPNGKCYERGYPGCNCEFKHACETYMHPEVLGVALEDLADEIADVIQAACNLAARYDLDLGAAMERCERRNRKRGRYE